MLESVEWGEYRLGDLFEILSTKKKFDANKVVIGDKGHPYVVRTSQNNGIRGLIEADESYLNDGNTISFGQDTATMYYQPTPYFTGDKIKVLRPKFNQFSSRNAQFFISCLQKPFMSFSWGASSFNVKTLEQQVVRLPTREGEIDYEFMERFIAELNAQRLAELNAYLSITGLKDYTLTPEEEQAVKDFEAGNVEWGEYRLGDLFEIRPTKAYKYTNRDLFSFSGDTPVVTNTSLNNGISGTVGLDPTEAGGIITYSDTTTSDAIFYQPYPFVGYSHIQGLYPKNREWSKNALLYVVVSFRKSSNGLFDYGNKFNRAIASDMSIALPTREGEIDFVCMETLISAIQKLVIKDVVLYADREIEATKNVIDKTSKSNSI